MVVRLENTYLAPGKWNTRKVIVRLCDWVNKTSEFFIYHLRVVSGFDNWRIRHVRTYVRTPNWISVRMNWDMGMLTRTLLFSLSFLNCSKFFFRFLWYYTVEKLTATCMAFNLFVLGRARSFTVYICFKEALFFNFSYKLFLNIIYVFIIKLWKSRTCAVMVLLEGTVF